MSATTLTMTNGPSSSNSSTGQPHSTSAPSSGIGTQTSITTPTRTPTIQSTTPPMTTSTPPESRSSTPSTPTPTPPKPSSSHTASADKLRLNRLSHISVATWVGVGLALAALVVAVYYGKPVMRGMRLAIWTAKNDFREACKSELDTALPQTSACREALDQPPQPPPIKKRGITVVHGHGLGLDPSVLATCCMLLVLLYIVVKNLMRSSRKRLEQIKKLVGLSTSAHILSKRGALIRLLLDTAHRLEVEGDEWELPAKLKAELIAMIEQSTTSSTQHDSVREPLGLEPPPPQDMCTRLLGPGEESWMHTVPLREDDGHLIPPTGTRQQIETEKSSPSRRTSEKDTEAVDDGLGDKRPKSPLRLVGLLVGHTSILFICSDVYTGRSHYHWSIIWLIRKSVRILVSSTALYELSRLQRDSFRSSLSFLPVFIGLMTTSNALREHMGRKGSMLPLFILLFLVLTLFISIIALFISVRGVVWVRRNLDLGSLLGYLLVLTIFVIEFIFYNS